MACPTEADFTAQNGYSEANLITIDYEKLLKEDLTEKAALFKSCSDSGFFYLDLSNSQFKHYREAVKALLDASKYYFTRPFEDKMKDCAQELDVFNICGYKPLGELGLDVGNVENKKNGCEHLRIPTDIFFNPQADVRLQCAKGAEQHWDLLEKFIRDSYTISTTVLSRLSDVIGLEGSSRFEDFHKSSEPSTSIASLQHYPATDLPQDTSVGHFAHTDAGSLTILFNSDEGLQAFSTLRNVWENVAPRKHCAIVNVGDTLRFLSRFRLTSSLHRVIPWQSRSLSTLRPPRCEPRLATIFFLRPNNNVKFVDGEGVVWTAEEWIRRKFQNYRASHAEQGLNAISTGKKGFTGVLDASKETITRV